MMRLIWTILAAGMLAACSGGAMPSAEGERNREGGIGGTGIVLVAGGEGGIGGTGAPMLAAATGTVTGFGSVHVNGLRVVFEEETLTPEGEAFRASEVDLGETVEIVGDLRGNGTVAARYAALRPALAGILRIDGAGTMRVDGVAVTLEPGAPVTGGSLAEGDRVVVSGLPRGDRIVASRIERIAPDAPLPALPRRGLLERLGTPVGNVIVEGYARARPDRTAGLSIDGFAPPVDPGSRLDAVGPGRALFIGSLANGVFTVRHGLPLPETAAARRARLDAVVDPFAPEGAIDTR